MPNSNSSPVTHAPLKVLFIHGLESGPGGSKDRYLQDHFDVLTPDMQISLYRLSKSNSVVRNALRRPLFLGWAAGASISLACVIILYGPLAWFVWSILVAVALAVIWKPLERQALSASVERCVAIQARAIEGYRPDVVVASSWGAAIALICAARGIYSGPLLLLAPVLQLVYDRLGDADGQRWKNLCGRISAEAARRTLIVHGDQDETVHVAHSRAIAEVAGIELLVIPGGDHSLNSDLVNSAEGRGLNDRLRQFVVEVASRG